MKNSKKLISVVLTFCMIFSLLTCAAMAADNENEQASETEATIRITYDVKEIRPGDQIRATYTLVAPIEGLGSFSVKAAVPEGLTLTHVSTGSKIGAGALYGGDGEVTSNAYSPSIVSTAYWPASYTSDQDLELYTILFQASDELKAGEEIVFEMDTASFSFSNIGRVTANVEAEPLKVVVVDTSELETEVKMAENMLGSEDYYSDASFAALMEALEAAQTILENIHDYYQDNVDQALDDLTAAYEGLKTPAEELDAAIESASQLRESDYTTDSWAAMTEALEAAKDIRDSDSATKADMNAAADALYAAINALEALPEDEALAASRKALEQLVQEAKELNESDYSESTWTALQTAIETAENVLDNDDATKEELDDAYDALALAMSRAQLEKTIEMAKLLSESDYDADSWAALQAAIEAAEAVLNNENATKQELDDAYDALIEAMNAGNSSNTYPYNTNNGNGGTGSSGGVVTSPQTGDSNILLMSMFLLAAGMGTCAVACVSKARRVKE